MQIRPIGKNILISKQKPKEVKKGELYLPKSNDDNREYLVIAIGEKAEVNAKIGDKVFIREYNHSIKCHETPDEIYYLTVQDDILGVYSC